MDKNDPYLYHWVLIDLNWSALGGAKNKKYISTPQSKIDLDLMIYDVANTCGLPGGQTSLWKSSVVRKGERRSRLRSQDCPYFALDL